MGEASKGRGVRPAGRSARAGRAGRAACAATGKVRYRDGHDAALALKAARRRRARAERDGAEHQIRVCRKYPCESCGGWHLTSQALPEWTAA